MKTTPVLRVALVLAAALSFAADWPDYRGPELNGHAPASAGGYPVKWSETEHVRWKTAVHGRAWSTPAIHGGQIWMTTAAEDGTEMFAVCVDRESGRILLDEKLWDVADPAPLGNDVNSYGSPSPVIEEGRVYLSFGSYGTVCYDTGGLRRIWTNRELPCDHFRGPGSSPVLFENLLILTMDGADRQYLAALDKETGSLVWRRDRSTNFDDLDKQTGKPMRDGDMRKAYNTPVFAEVGGKTQMISCGAKAAWAYDPRTGDEIWSVHYPGHSSASRPVLNEKLGLVYLNSGYSKAELWAVRLDGTTRGEVSGTHVLWKQAQRMPLRSSPVLVGDRLYMATDGGIASCLDAKSGEVVWQERLDDLFTAAALYAGGRLYFCGEMGKTIVVEPADTFTVLAENTLADGMMASPAAADGALYLRTRTHLYRIEE